METLENSVEEIKKAKEELVYLSGDKEQRELYLRRKMAISDRVSDLENAEKKGEENMQLGIARNLLDVLDDEMIAKKTGLDIDKVMNLRSECIE